MNFTTYMMKAFDKSVWANLAHRATLTSKWSAL